GNLQRAKIDLDKITSKTLSEITKLQSEKAEALASSSKAADELAKTEVKLSTAIVRQDISSIRSPSDGIVVKLLKRGPGETFKENEEVAVITPETTDQAVEIFVSDIDAPLISRGDPVRLQFSGWPALQFAGFSDNIQLGTFGGKVAVVDNVDSGNGKYRVLVVPDESVDSLRNQPWPKSEYLRPGTRAAGWVILKTVPLGYELWRRFNGFPIALTDVNDEASQKSDSSLGQSYSTSSGKEVSKIFKKKTK
ncbi:MAG: HlyD family efflux transporter periplasmic adaptor subunit, partial [Candidatus Caenarcaniphilales bacterium]|nr:HlyD family efflux transporter periplasmic adaptor subunit [Candidatus Caenarcaniphilales bacterium]